MSETKEIKSTFADVRRGTVVVVNGINKKVTQIDTNKGFNSKRKEPDGNRLRLTFEDRSQLIGQEKHPITICI